jgi:hypothetical protein
LSCLIDTLLPNVSRNRAAQMSAGVGSGGRLKGALVAGSRASANPLCRKRSPPKAMDERAAPVSSHLPGNRPPANLDQGEVVPSPQDATAETRERVYRSTRQHG